MMKNAPAVGDGPMGGEDEGAVMYMHRAVLQPHGSLRGCYCSVGIRFTHGVLDSPCTFYFPSSAGARNLTHENKTREPQSNSNGNLNKTYSGRPWLRGQPRLFLQMAFEFEALVRPPRAILG